MATTRSKKRKPSRGRKRPSPRRARTRKSALRAHLGKLNRAVDLDLGGVLGDLIETLRDDTARDVARQSKGRVKSKG